MAEKKKTPVDIFTDETLQFLLNHSKWEKERACEFRANLFKSKISLWLTMKNLQTE